MVSIHELEPTGDIKLYPPASDYLRDPEISSSAWPETAADFPSFIDQVEKHSYLITSVANVLDKTEDSTTTIEEYYTDQTLTANELIDFYNSLSYLISASDTERILLYIPFEYLPRNGWEVLDSSLSSAIDGFKDRYIDAWYRLLNLQDARANFIDGDVLESDHRDGDLPRVIKAAQIAPMLVSLGLLNTEDLRDIIGSTDDPLLRSDLLASIKSTESDPIDEAKTMHVTALLPLRKIIEDIEDDTDNNTEATAELTPNRSKWLSQRHETRKVDRISEQLSSHILRADDPEKLIQSLLDCSNIETALASLINGLGVATEKVFQTDRSAALSLFKRYEDILIDLPYEANSGVISQRNRLIKRLHHMGIIPEDALEGYGVQLTRLSGSLVTNLELIPERIERLQQIAEVIASDEELEYFLYPIIAVGGSQLKGYGETDSDLDLCVFIKPDIPECYRDIIRSRLTQLFVDQGGQDQPIEIWLSEKDGLTVVNHDKFDSYFADEYWTHILFSNAWVGTEEAATTLQEKLLTQYFKEPKNDDEVRKRSNYLERLEQDILQYRLLHKGYDRVYPQAQGRFIPHSNSPDSQGTFWDPGYRKLATRLFVEKVFLPQI